MSEPIRVLVADDHPMVRAGTCAILEADEGISIVGQVADGEQALSAVEAERPDVLLMDLSMPRMDGVEATRRIRERKLPVGIVMLTAHGEDDFVLRALQAGANGYLLKTASEAQLIEAVRLVAAGKPAILQPEVSQVVMGGLQRSAKPEAPIEPLTDREVAVLAQVARDLGNKQIATLLGISDRTVQQHLSNIYGKLGVTSRTGAVLRALQQGDLQLSEIQF